MMKGMPEDWESKSLGDLAIINYGRSPAEILAIDGPYPVVGTGGAERLGSDYLYEGESIILGRKGTIDRVHFVSGRFWTIDTAYYLSDFTDSIPRWLFYFLQTIDLRQKNEATGVPSLSRDLLYEIRIPTPPKPEQDKIAEILSTVDQAIEQTETLIAKQQRIKIGLMQDLLTRGIDGYGNIRSEQTHEFKDSPLGRIPVEWDPLQIGSVATLQRGHDITENELRYGPYPVVSSSGVIGYHLQCTSKGPNVVIGRKGTIGKVHFLKGDFWAHDTSLYVTNFRGNNVRYLFYLFTYLELAKYGTKSGSPSLNRNDIHPLWIGLPSPGEQNKIAMVLMKCDQKLDSLSQVVEKLHSIKSALMQDLLTGKKRVTPLLKDMEVISV